jgi:succinate dehydrogenase / fumarate reductase cytochrome b subunit
MHLYHGISSMFQSLGFSHPKYTPGIQRFAKVASFLIWAGYVSIPVAVLAGVVS